MTKRIMPPPLCFWCRERIGTTRDHIISRPLFASPECRAHFQKRTAIVPCCPQCNHWRSKLSNTFKQAVRLAKSTFHYKSDIENFLRARESCMQMMHRWIALYYERLGSPLRDICLFEADTVVNFTFPERKTTCLPAASTPLAHSVIPTC